MAATVTANLTTVTDGESDSGSWTNTDGTDTEIFIQNTGSESWYVAKNSTPTGTFDAYAKNGNVAYDLSATDTHLYFWVYSTVALLNATKANSGLTVILEDGSANWSEWKVAGSDTWDGRWTCFVQDVNATRDAGSGTLVLTDIRLVKFYVNAGGTSYRSSSGNYWIDAIRFGTGLTVTGTAFNLEDIAAIDEAVANKYGVLQNVDGVLFCQGRIILGDATGSVTTTFSSTNEAVYFADRPVSTGLYQLNAVASATATTTLTIDGLVCKTVGTSRADVDFSDTDLGTSTIDNATFLDMGLVKFDALTTIDACKFNNCLQIDPSTATFENNTLLNYVGTEGGALLWPGGTTVQYCTFVNCYYGVEIPQATNQTFLGLQFDDEVGNYDVGLSGGTSIEVAKTGSPAANPNSYYDHTVSGDTVTFTASFAHTLTGMAENTEVTYVKQGDSSVLFHVEDVTVTGTTTYTHSGGDLVDILIFHIDKLPEVSCIYDVTLPNGDTSIKITQFNDPDYVNPD